MTGRYKTWICAMVALSGITLATARPTGADPAPEINLQVAQSGPLKSMAFSPDGSTLAVAGDSLKLWDTKTGQIERNLPQVECSQVVFSPDGRTITSWGGHVVSSWDTQTGRLKARYETGASAFGGAFLRDGEYLVGGPNTIKLWDVRNGKHLRTFSVVPKAADDESFNRIEVSSDGSTIAASTTTNVVDVWRSATGVLVQSIKMASSLPSFPQFAISSDGSLIATPSAATVTIWNVATGKALRTIDDSRVTSLAFAADCSFLVEGSGWDTDPIRLRSASTGALIKTMSGGDAYGVCGMALSPDGSTLAVFGWSGRMNFWNVSTATLRPSAIPPRAAAARFLASSAGGRRLLTLMDGMPVVWDMLRGRPLHLSASVTEPTSALACRGDGQIVAAGQVGTSIELRDAITGRLIRRIPSGTPDKLNIYLSPNASAVAAQCLKGGLMVWSVETGAELDRWRTPADPYGLWHAKFSPSGSKLEAPYENDFFLFDVRTGRTHQLASSDTSSEAFSADGSRLMATIYSDQVITWSTRTLRRLAMPANIPTFGFDLAYVGGGSQVAFATLTGVQVYDTCSGKAVRTLPGEHGAPMRVAFTPDGARAVTTSLDGAIRIWDVQTGDLLTTSYVVPGPSYDPKSLKDEVENGGRHDLGADYGWLTVTPAGYFDCSSRAVAEKYIRWTVGDTIYPADKFYDRFHRPDLVRAALATGLTH